MLGVKNTGSGATQADLDVKDAQLAAKTQQITALTSLLNINPDYAYYISMQGRGSGGENGIQSQWITIRKLLKNGTTKTFTHSGDRHIDLADNTRLAMDDFDFIIETSSITNKVESIGHGTFTKCYLKAKKKMALLFMPIYTIAATGDTTYKLTYDGTTYTLIPTTKNMMKLTPVTIKEVRANNNITIDATYPASSSPETTVFLVFVKEL